jgi:uncharacterized protein with beta-barrel porin domain
MQTEKTRVKSHAPRAVMTAPRALTACSLLVLSASAACAAGPTTQFTISGQVANPQTVTLSTLQALTPTTLNNVTYTSGGTPVTGSFTGVQFWTLLNTVAGIKTNSTIKNDILRQVVLVTGSDGYQAAFSGGELNPSFGGSATSPDLVAYANNGASLGTNGFARTVVPGDTAGGRYVSNIQSIEVIHAPVMTGTFSGGLTTLFTVTGNVTAPRTFNLASLEALPTTTVTYTPTGVSYTGVSLWTLLTTVGVTTNATIKNDILRDYVVATGSDGYQAVVALGEISPSFGNQKDIIAYAQNGGTPGTSLGANGFARLVVPGDLIKQGRWVSNLINLEVFDASVWVANTGESVDLTGLAITTQGVHLNGGALISTGGAGTLTAPTYTLDGGVIAAGVTLGPTGALVQNSGTSTLQGSISAPTSIVGGTLLLQGGSITSTVAVNGGVLAGSGSVGATTVASGGVVSPGGAAGNVLTVNGALSFASGSTLAITASPTAATSLAVTGPATIGGGAVTVTAGSGTYNPSTTYVLLTSSGGVTGQFAGVTSNLAFLSPLLTYDANDVYLSLARNDLKFASVAATPNQLAVAQALDSINWGGASQAGVSILNALDRLSAPRARAGLDLLGGAGIAAANQAALQDGAAFAGAISDQAYFGLLGVGPDASGVSHFTPSAVMAYAGDDAVKGPIVIKGPPPAPERDWRAWGVFVGGGANIDADPSRGAAASTSSGYGGLAGLDYRIQPNWLVGLALGGSDTHFAVNALATSGETTAFHAGLYSIVGLNQGFYAQVQETVSVANSHTNRTASFGGLSSAKLTGAFNAIEERTRLEFGRAVIVSGVNVAPFVAAEFASLQSDGFTETGPAGLSALALSAAAQTTISAPVFVGFKLQGAYSVAPGWTALPNVSLAWTHEFSQDRKVNASLVSLPSTDFTVFGPRPASDVALVKAGLRLAGPDNLTLFADFTGEFAPSSSSYGGKGGVQLAF